MDRPHNAPGLETLGDILKRLGVTRTTVTEAEGEETSENPPPCPICKGLGFLRRDMPIGDPDFGRLFPCACSEAALAERRRDRLERLSNLGALARLTFDNLIADGRNPETPENRHRFRQSVEAARRFAEEPNGWLILVGPPGCGKTHLAAAIANARIARSEPALFAVVPDLLDHLRATFSPTSEVPYDELFESLRTTPLLILDDLGTQSSTPWAQEKLYQLFNARYNGRLPTVVTTNHPLDAIDERLRVRITDLGVSQVCHLQAPQSAALQRIAAAPDRRFETFEPEGRCRTDEQRESLRAALEAAQDYAHDPSGWLVLQGLHGCGKTHLAAAIANGRLGHNLPATFVSVPDLLDHLRSTFAPHSPVTYDQLFETIRTAPLLILDDLGTQSSTPWAQEKLYQLLNYRYNGQLPTVVTTNLSLDELEPRLASRLADQSLSRVYWIDAPDYRWPESPGRTAEERATYPSSQRPQRGRGFQPPPRRRG